MLTLVFTIGLLNLLLGFLLATLWEPPRWERLAGPSRWTAMAWEVVGGLRLPTLRTWPARVPADQRAAGDRADGCAPDPEPGAAPSEAPATGLSQANDAHGPDRQPSGPSSPSAQGPALDAASFEAVVRGWMERDADRVRMASGMLVKLHRPEELGDALDDVTAEKLGAAFAGLLESLARKDRGFDRVARLDNDSFLLFLGDTALRNAISTAERIRQTISSVTFKVGERLVSLTSSCAVAEWTSMETSDQWLSRLRRILHEAIESGGQQCYVEDASGTRPIPASPAVVPQRDVCVAVD